MSPADGRRWGEATGPRLPAFVTVRPAVAAVVGAAVAGVPAGPTWVLVGGWLLAVAVATVADAVRAVDPAGLDCTRRLPDVGVTGRPDEIELTVRNPTGRPLQIDVHDATAPSLHRTPRRHRDVTLPANGRTTLRATVTPRRRGHRHVGPLTLRAAGPWGLAGRQRTLHAPGTLRVHPPLPGRRAALAILRDAQRQPLGARPTRVTGRGTTFDSLREYHPDDPYRTINWRATARAADPVTNVYTEERNQQVVVLLDASRICAGSVAGAPRVEWSIDAAVALADVAARFGDHVGAATFDDRLRSLVLPRPGRRQAARVLDAIFDVEPTLRAPAYRSVFATLLARHGRRSLLVLLTDLVDEAAMAPLMDALPVLVRRHLVTVAAARDDDVERTARAVPRTPDRVYAKVAAAESVAARATTARRLQRLGARVIDEPATGLAVALAKDYLSVKRAGRL